MTVNGPNGVTINFPDGTDPDTIHSVMLQATGMGQPDNYGRNAAPPQPEDNATQAANADLADAANQRRIELQDPGALTTGISHFAQGATANFSDEIMAGLKTGFGLAGDYGPALQHERDILSRGQEAHPIIAGASEIGGALGTLAIPGVGALGTVARGAGLGAKALAGAKVGAAYGAAAGAGAADGGIGERGAAALGGAATGAITGGILPVGLAAGRAVLAPVASAVASRLNPEGFAAGKVAERVGNVDQAATRMQRAADNGQNLSLADVGGKRAQGLLRTAANQPGPGQDEIATRISISSLGQGDRLRRIVGETLADPNGYQDAKAAVMDARSHAAAPYYEMAYARPVPFTHDLEGMLNTPAGRAALAGARTNSLNRREPWAQWFANVADDGSIIDARRVPDTRALDEVKRSLDSMVNDAMAAPTNSPFARPRATPRSIAIASVRDDLVNFLDTHNPAYRQARRVGLDNIQADEALEFGRGALTNDARVNARRMGLGGAGRDVVLTEAQREVARIGAAEAVRAKIDSAGWTHNAILTFFKSSESARRLRPFFRTQEEWNTFRSAIYNEARRAKTANAVRGNSTTAAQLMDAQDAGVAADVVRGGVQAARGDALGAAVNAVVSGMQRLGGLTPRVAQHIGRMLMTRDPQQVAAIIGQVRAIEARNLGRERTANQIRRLLTAFAGNQEGTALGSQLNGQPALQ